MKKTALLPTLIALILGAAGVLLLLFAWHLPPFAPATPRTESAYLRGEMTQIAPQLAGYVTAVEVRDYQEVAQGDIIAHIDDRIPRQKLAQAEAQLAGARAALKVSEQNIHSAEAGARASEAALSAAGSSLDTTRSQAERAGRLLDRGVASQSASDQAENALQQAEAVRIQAAAQLEVQSEAVQSARVALDARRAEIAGAEAAVELARIELANTVIRAPADGRLGQLGVHVGQYVAPGTALVSHVGTELWIVANFRETNLVGLVPGTGIDFTVDALGGRHFEGRVDALSPATASEFGLMSSTASSGNFTKIAQRLPVRIAIEPGQDGTEALRAGMSVIVEAR